MAEGDAQPDQPLPQKKRRIVTGRSTNAFLRSWAWKREHSVRFEQPYGHTLRVPNEPEDRTLSIQQAPFNAEGFASTVWDSSIVVARFLEKQAALAAAAGSSSSRPGGGAEPPALSGIAHNSADGSLTDRRGADCAAVAPAAEDAAAVNGSDSLEAGYQAAGAHPGAHAGAAGQLTPAAANSVSAPQPPAQAADAQQPATHPVLEAQSPAGVVSLQDQRCLDLSAGCGLVGIVMALLGGRATVTDLRPNLPLLRTNCAASGAGRGEHAVKVMEHEWGTDTAALDPPFDIVVACDVMYIDDAVDPLVKTLAAVSDQKTKIFIAHGRNRQAETRFLAAAKPHFEVSEVPSKDLDEVYQCTDVAVWCLKRRQCVSEP